MIKLDAGNVLLKPTQRKQLLSGLKRCSRLGERLGNFLLTVSVHRLGKVIELRAGVNARFGQFNFRVRQSDWRHAVRTMVNLLVARVHEQFLLRQALST